jgi:hypothetical protein
VDEVLSEIDTNTATAERLTTVVTSPVTAVSSAIPEGLSHRRDPTTVEQVEVLADAELASGHAESRWKDAVVIDRYEALLAGTNPPAFGLGG